jgi:hypothetical protein
MGAGVTNAGYDEGQGATFLNGEASATIFRGELVEWDTSGPATTDSALRVKKLTADATTNLVGVALRDIPAGTYGPVDYIGRVRARVDSGVTAGSVLVGDFVAASGTIPNLGKMKVRVAGTYPACAVAITAATQEPAGSGQYWADVVLAGLNAAGIQQMLRGGGPSSNVASLDMIGKAAAFEGYLRMPDMLGAFINLEVLTETTITGDTSNLWVIGMDHSPFNGTVPVCVLSLINGVDVVRGTPKLIPATVNFSFTPRELIRVSFTVGAGSPTSLAAVRLKFYATYDTGLQAPLLFGR